MSTQVIICHGKKKGNNMHITISYMFAYITTEDHNWYGELCLRISTLYFIIKNTEKSIESIQDVLNMAKKEITRIIKNVKTREKNRL